MAESEVSPNQAEPSGEIFHVFFSHKIRKKGNAAKQIKTWLENQGRGRLKIFVSELGIGDRWSPTVYDHLRKADLLILLYTDPTVEMDWCLYESGFFVAISENKGGKLFCLAPPGVEVPAPLKGWNNAEATEEGIRGMLKAVFKDERISVAPELFADNNLEILDHLVKRIKKLVGPGPCRRDLAPQLRITVRGLDLRLLRGGCIAEEVVVSGEPETFRQLGLELPGPMTWRQFVRLFGNGKTMGLFSYQLARTLAEALEGKPARSAIPPIRFRPDGKPWSFTLIRLATWGLRLEDLLAREVEISDETKVDFELALSRPVLSFDAIAGEPLVTVFHLLTAAWHCNWRVTGRHLKTLKYLASGRPEVEEVSEKLKEVRDDLQTVLLDCLNRGLMYPDLAKDAFSDKGQQAAVNAIVDPEAGKWARTWGQLLQATEEGDLEKAVAALEETEGISAAILDLSAGRLQKLIAERRPQAPAC